MILERSDKRAEEARNLGYLTVQADATDEGALKTAGIDRARALATVLPDDAANVFITLSARSLNRSLEIIARGEVPSTERKLRQAGADKVVLPTHIGAERIAEMILYPGAESLVRGSDKTRDVDRALATLGLQMEVMVAAEDGPLIGRTIADIEKQANGAFLVVQLKQKSGETRKIPAGDQLVEAGDGLVCVFREGLAGFTAAPA
jgi:Trk K+ transport system NAD-binding subunit